MKISEMFEGENSTLRKTFDEAVADIDFPEVEKPKPVNPEAVTKPRIHISDSACIACEG